MRYYPFGEVRWQNGSTPTGRTYTGQMAEPSGLGSLMDYNAREYSPVLGRFLSADTIVPNPNNSQDFNRYAYVRNSPLKYTDSTGHTIDGYTPDWAQYIVYGGALAAVGAVYYSNPQIARQAEQAIRVLDTSSRSLAETPPQLTNTAHGDTPVAEIPYVLAFPLGSADQLKPVVEGYPLGQQPGSIICTTPLDEGTTNRLSQLPQYLANGSRTDKWVDAIANKYKMTRSERQGFGDYIEKEKSGSGSGGSEGGINARGDFSYGDLDRLAREYLELPDDATPSDIRAREQNK